MLNRCQYLYVTAFVLLVSTTIQAYGGQLNNLLLSTAPKVSAEIKQALLLGQYQDVLVEFDDSNIQTSATEMRRVAGVKLDTAIILDFKANEYVKLKSSAMAGITTNEYKTLIEYSHLPLSFVRIKTTAVLQALLADPRVKAIHKNGILYPTLDSVSAGFVNQPAVNARGYAGAGAAVAVIDSGVNYTLADFGCTSPGIPAGCKVAFYKNFADTSSSLDATGHGTNVAGIVVGVAPGAKVIALNVFGASSTTTDALVISAMNWAIQNRATYNIQSINLSLGDNVNHGDGLGSIGSDCRNTAYQPAYFAANTAGIYTFAAAGNNGFSNGVSSPACTYGGTAVGAVHDSTHGAINFGICTDPGGSADQTACFTNLPPVGAATGYSYVMAPGVNITAGGLTYSGTSQAAPFVTAALAIKGAALPVSAAQLPRYSGPNPLANCEGWTLIPISRSGYIGTMPRLDLTQCLTDYNDNFFFNGGFFLYNIVLDNVFATKEAGEPNHAGNTGGHSTWTIFTPTVSSPVKIDTHLSNFDTLLAVYTGTSVSALTPIASNDDDGSPGGTSSVTFQAQAGTSYRVVVDGKNGASGIYDLNTKYISADLSMVMSGANVAPQSIQFNIDVKNAGPGDAPNVKVIVNLPNGTSIDPNNAGGCSASSSNVVTCLLGTINASSSVSVMFNIIVSAPQGNLTTTASVSSDYIDPNISNNSVLFPNGEGDVPTLPEWGMILFGFLLLGSMLIQYRNQNVVRH